METLCVPVFWPGDVRSPWTGQWSVSPGDSISIPGAAQPAGETVARERRLVRAPPSSSSYFLLWETENLMDIQKKCSFGVLGNSNDRLSADDKTNSPGLMVCFT